MNKFIPRALVFTTICLAVTPLLASSHMKIPPDRTLFQFVGAEADSVWPATNDGVMGGLSQGAAVRTAEGMKFSGRLSLENNGGFSSIYRNGSFDLSDYQGIRVRVLGDGRSYQLRLQSDALFRQRRPVAFSHTFKTVEGEWLDVFLPFNELQQSWRGMQLSGHVFNPAKVQRIGFMLADKKAGPFAMTVATVYASKAE